MIYVEPHDLWSLMELHDLCGALWSRMIYVEPHDLCGARRGTGNYFYTCVQHVQEK
jgi:hypothetical protein